MRVVSSGGFDKTEAMLKRSMNVTRHINLDKYGKKGVEALAAATPTNTGATASSWYYKIERSKGKTSLVFGNSNIQNGVPIAIILQYGHGTRNGGWVEGQDYINPAIRPIFDELANAAWKEVIKK